MTDRYDVVYKVRRKDGTEFSRTCGVAFPHKQGGGFSLILEAMPFPAEPGQVRLALFPAKPKEATRAEPAQSSGYELDDSIPF